MDHGGYDSPNDTVTTEDEYGTGTECAPSECYGSPNMTEYRSLYDEWSGIAQKENQRDRTSSFLSNLHVPRNSICNQNTVVSMASVAAGPSRKNTTKLLENPNLFARTLSEKLAGPWIEHAFQKRECVKFIPVETDGERCGCGRSMSAHSQLALSRFSLYPGRMTVERGTWSIAEHTQVSKTDAFGTIVFQGGAHAHKAQYVRVGFDSEPEDIMYLMEKVWHLPPPRLVITVHGGMSNFEVQDKLGRLFREGLLKAAQTTGAWIITHGVDSGVVRHVAQALDEAGISARMRSRIVTIGIAPWGVLKRREKLIGKDIVVQYDPHSFHSQKGFVVLNDRHSYFLLADNGTSGRHGADMKLRKSLEYYIANLSLGHGDRKVPIVCAVLEGGTSTITAVHHYLTGEPQVPVIVCDGSGRGSDLLAFAKRYTDSDGIFPEEVQAQLLDLIGAVLPSTATTPERLLEMIVECAKQEDLLTVFRFGEHKNEDVDHAILTAILNRQNLSLPDQLALTLAWNRVDIARACLFATGKSWPAQALHGAMMDALRLNRVEFVECLLENGVSMKKFLTVNCLEQLYNLDQDAVHSVRTLVTNDGNEMTKYLELPEIGTIIEKLMGNAYKCYYSSRKFKKEKYERTRGNRNPSKIQIIQQRFQKKHKREKSLEEIQLKTSEGETVSDFSFPFNDLLVWSILTRRPEMARCMWLHGEDALAKSLCAVRLYKSIARVAEEEYLELEVAKKLREHADIFRAESLDLLDHCYRADGEITVKLLTAELPHWGHHTVLSLAVLANNKAFLAHQCCQLLLAELWHGNLRVRSRSSLRVLSALLCPPSVLTLAFKEPARDREKGEKERKKDSYGEMADVRDFYVDLFPSHPSNLKHKSVGDRLSSIFKYSLASPKPNAYSYNYRSEESADLMENSNKRVTFGKESMSRKPSMYRSSESFGRFSAPTLTPLQKFYAFYTAPITKFWSWSLSFHTFLMAFIYVLLIETPLVPTRIEWSLLIYMIGFAMEHFRKLISMESLSWRERFRVFFSRYWNVFTAVSLISFFIGFAFRMNPPTRHSYGRIILTVSNVLWHMKTLEYMSVHPLLGPYINMAAKMIVAMSYIIVLLLVTLMAFGVSRQAITYPHEKWRWLLLREIFYKPYFMLYGEVYAGEIDTCGDDGENCIPGIWLPPIFMTLFLLVANILLINMLIAIFNNIFNKTIVKSQEVWLFERYQQVLEYDDTPLLPPPFTIIALIVRGFSLCCKKNKKSGPRRMGMLDFTMKLNLDAEELRYVHDFEEDCMDELTREKTHCEKGNAEEKLRVAAEQTELVVQKMCELLQENLALKNRMCDVEKVLDGLSHGQRHIFELVIKDKKQHGSRRRPAHLSHQSDSTQSLPDAVNAESKQRKREDPSRETFCVIRFGKERNRRAEYTSITDQILLSTVTERKPTVSPLVSRMRSDHTLRKYDDARYVSPLLRNRCRLNSSSMSISNDLTEMERTTRTTSTDEDPPDIPLVHGIQEISSDSPQ